MAAAAIKKDCAAGAALPRVEAEMPQNVSLQEAIAIDSHGNRALTRWTSNFVRPNHNVAYPECPFRFEPPERLIMVDKMGAASY
jgi:hypothetical protein